MSTESRTLRSDNSNDVAQHLEQSMFRSPVVIAAVIVVIIAVVTLFTNNATASSREDMAVEANLLRLAIVAFAFLAVLFAQIDRKSAVITIRAQKEATRDAHERTRLLHVEHVALMNTLDSVTEGIIHTDPKGIVRYVNGAAGRMTGVANSEAVGHPLEKIARLFHHETNAKLALPTVKALKELAPVRPSHSVLMTVSGVSTHVDAGATPLWADDQMVGVALILTDLTSRLRLEGDLRARVAQLEGEVRESAKAREVAEKTVAERIERAEKQAAERGERAERAAAQKAETQLRESAERLEALLAASLDAALLADDRGLITHASPSAVRLFAEGTLMPLTSRPLATFLPAPLSANLAAPREGTACRSNGTVFPVLSVASALPGGRGHAVVVHDLTEQKRLNARLRALETSTEQGKQERVDLLESLSDDLRGPLNGIIGYSEMLQEEAEERDAKDLIPDIEKIKTGGRHLLTLANDLLNLSKLENGQVDLYLQTFSIPETMGWVANSLRPMLDKNANALEVHCPENIGTMYADTTKLQQSLVYSVMSFCKFTVRRTIRIEVARETGAREWIAFRVFDAGHGEDAESAPWATSAAQAGQRTDAAGLAVSISRRFCLMMGGDIEVGTEPGRGRALIIRIPAEVAMPKSRAA